MPEQHRSRTVPSAPLAPLALLARLALSALLVTVVATPGTLAAQSCLGLPAPEAARYTVGAAADGDSRTRSYGTRLARLASTRFIAANASVVRNTAREANAVVVGASVGGILPIETVQRARLCPYLALNYANGPDYTLNGIAFTNRTASATGYLAVGMTVETGNVALVPFARIGAQVRDVRQRRSRGADTLQIVSNDVGGLAGAGLGVRIGNRFTLTPSVTVPVIGFPGATALVGISATVGFGRPSATAAAAAPRTAR